MNSTQIRLVAGSLLVALALSLTPVWAAADDKEFAVPVSARPRPH